MLFSENPDQLIDELKDYIQIASSYDCSRIQNLLLATENTYIIALLGTKLFNRIAKDQTTFPEKSECAGKQLQTSLCMRISHS